MKTDILFEKHYIYVPKLEIKDKKASAYYATYLLTNYGIEIKNPEYLDINALSVVEDVFSLTVPPSFYENPQDTRYFSCEELYIEQIFSYFFNYGSNDKRIELFSKALPTYFVGTESKIRTYEIIDEEKAKPILIEYANSLAAYKRPFSSIERKRFRYLIEEGYINIHEIKICSKDNIFDLLYEYPFLASQLDLKDIVKYSVYLFGEDDNFAITIKKQQDRIDAFKEMLKVVKKCPLSKKQAKYLNRIYKVCGLKNRLDNSTSPYRIMKEKLKNNDVIGAAEAIKDSGSLFLRNIKYLISRAKNKEEVITLIDMIPNNNPSVLYQLLSNIYMDRYGRPRVFRFIKPDTVARVYKESEYESHYRKSIIRSDFVSLVSEKLITKLKEHYSSLPKLGKIYVSEKFKRIALPINTSACGNGLDVLPTGSRIKFEADYLRTFCYWHDALDIDASLAIIDEDEFLRNDYNSNFALSWRTYSQKIFGDYALCSGDDTSRDGAEYQDIDINGLVRSGYRYAVFCINGYGQTFEKGQIRCGVQIKKRLTNKAWDPKNIEFQIDIKGACRSFTCFALDMFTKEIIIINMKSNFGCVVNDYQVAMAFNYLDEHFLDFNIYEMAILRGEVTSNIEEADVVFDDDYLAKENQQVIRTYDVAKLAELSK